MRPETDRPGRRGLAAFVLLVAALILVPFALWNGVLAQMSLAALDQSGTALSALVTMLLLAADFLLPVPSSLVMVSVGVALPAWVAFLSCFAGLMLGCGLGYGLGRGIGEPVLARMSGPDRRVALEGWFVSHGVAVISVCRAIPVLAELSVVMAGAARAPALRVLLACAAANAAMAGVYVTLGAQVSDLATFILAMLASCMVPLLGWLLLRAVTPERAREPQ